MTVRNPRKLFVNVAVRDLKRSKEFFSTLGFEFDAQFTDDRAACMVVSEEAYFMLLTEPFFRTFARHEPCDPRRATESMFAVSCGSRGEVDELADRALAAGGTRAGELQDHGFMYGRSFHDLDGHHWEVLWMDPAHVQR